MRILTLLLGLILGVLVLDDATKIDFLAGLAGTTNAATVSALAYVFALLTFAGAVLAIPAPRGAAVTFIVAGVLGLVLGVTTIWANAVVWGIAALVLAICAYVGYRRKRRKAERKMQAQALVSEG